MAVIYLVRHGQASLSEENYDKLSATGIKQSEKLGESLANRNVDFTSIIKGTLLRHDETAKNCLSKMNMAASETTSQAWNEYNYVELIAKHNIEFSDFKKLREHVIKEEKTYKALHQILNNSITDWIGDKHDYSVSWNAFKETIWSEFKEVAASLANSEKAIIFTSGGPIAVLLLKLLDLKDSQFIDIQGSITNASITKIDVGKTRFSLNTFNEHAHLELDKGLLTYR